MAEGSGWINLEETPYKVVRFLRGGEQMTTTFYRNRSVADMVARRSRPKRWRVVVMTAGLVNADGERIGMMTDKERPVGYPEWFTDDGRTLSQLIGI